MDQNNLEKELLNNKSMLNVDAQKEMLDYTMKKSFRYSMFILVITLFIMVVGVFAMLYIVPRYILPSYSKILTPGK